MTSSPTAAQKALRILEGEDPEEALFAFVRWLDLEMHEEDEREQTAERIFLLATVAMGDLVLSICPHDRARQNVLETKRAAEDAVLDPTEAKLEYLFAAASRSYPYGPGEGCYSVPGTGVEGCKPGSGCATAAGSLACQGLPAARVVPYLLEELRPWLEDSDR